METPRPTQPGSRLLRIFQAETVERLLCLAVTEGTISQVQRDHLEATTAVATPGELKQLLLAQGLMDERQFEALLARQAGADYARPSVLRSPPLPEGVREFAAVPERQLEEFVLCQRLGGGGASEVWKAWDRHLGRWVAVKISSASWESATARDRFEREALAAARLIHPHIVPIHRAGVDRGRAFLVMPFVTGQTLDHATLSVAQALQVMRTAATAVAHAHAMGVVHRDIKPGNIMVDDAGDVFLLDFGLAYLLEGDTARMTRPGEVLGTASYMSPEQARGDAKLHGREVDIYGLGATLYALVTHRPPFSGRSFAEVVAQVVQQEPPSPRRLNPDLDPRIETVIAKAMAKESRQRYSTADELADELRRLIDNEPIAARPPGWPARWRAGLYRHRIAGVVALALAAVIGVAAIARVRVRGERAAAMDAFRAMARLSLETALRLRRAGDPAGMRQLFPRLESAYQQARNRAPDLAEVDFLMGRMHRALLDERQALAFQDRALAKDPNYPPALYERVVLLAREYGRQRDRQLALPHLNDGEREDSTTQEGGKALAALRQSILDSSEKLAQLSLDPIGVTAIRGIFAFHQKRYDDARRALTAVIAQDTSREEVWEALARTEEAQQRWQQGIDVYTRALAQDRGYWPFLVGRCSIEVHDMRLLPARQDANQALALAPQAADAHLCRGTAAMLVGHREMTGGIDPAQTFQAAQTDLDEALRLVPTLTGALWTRGTLQRYRVHHALRHGDDPRPWLDASEADFTRALAGDGGAGRNYTGRGRSRTLAGVWGFMTGGDFLSAFAAAEADFDRARRSTSDGYEAWDWRAELHTQRAHALFLTGHDCADDITLAEDEFGHILTPQTHWPWVSFHRGRLRTLAARLACRRGETDGTLFRAAESDLDAAVAGLPDDADSWEARASLFLREAECRQSHKLAYSDRLQKAERDLRQARKIDSTLGTIWLEEGALAQLRGDGKTAQTCFTRAIALNRHLTAEVRRRAP